MHRSELDLTAHVPLDGADERDAERYTTTRLGSFRKKKPDLRHLRVDHATGSMYDV